MLKIISYIPYIMLGLLALLGILLCIAVCLKIFIIVYEIINLIKQQIILHKIKNIKQISLFPPKQVFREIREKTGYSEGYSARGHFMVNHYRIKKVAAGYERKMIAYFKSGRNMTVYINENSSTYKKLMSIAKFEENS